jgi:hypothetical protein
MNRANGTSFPIQDLSALSAPGVQAQLLPCSAGQLAGHPTTWGALTAQSATHLQGNVRVSPTKVVTWGCVCRSRTNLSHL